MARDVKRDESGARKGAAQQDERGSASLFTGSFTRRAIYDSFYHLAKFANEKDKHIKAISRSSDVKKLFLYYGSVIQFIDVTIKTYNDSDCPLGVDELHRLRFEILIALYSQSIIVNSVKFGIHDRRLLLETTKQQLEIIFVAYGFSIDERKEFIDSLKTTVNNATFPPPAPLPRSNVTAFRAAASQGKGLASEQHERAEAGIVSRVPKTAPDGQLYATHAKPGEDVVGFLDRVYGQRGFLTGEFTRADLRKIDEGAVIALEAWEQGGALRSKGRAPLNLPTRTERNNRLRNADPDTLTPAEKIARGRLLAIQRYQRKARSKDM